tara:strand:+ start:337 stop:708 length:372 start_codon:yes stop_codon:yes gene_type:complete
MSWKDIMKKDYGDTRLRRFNEFFNEFVEELTDSFIEEELEDYSRKRKLDSDNKDDEDIQQNYKNLEIALKEVLYDDLSNNIAMKLDEKLQEIFTEKDELGNLLVLLEVIERNEAKLDSRNLEW